MFYKKGTTLIEAVIYSAILAIVVIAVTDSLLVMMRSYASVKISRSINMAAQVALERMAREIRNADSVDDAGSIFATSTGKIKLNTEDADGAPATVEFSVSSSTVFVKEGASAPEPLTGSSVEIGDLIFNKISASSTSSGVKIKMGVTAKKKDIVRTENFYDTIILRGSY